MGILRPVMVISMISPLKLKRTSRFFEGPLMKLECRKRQFMLCGMRVGCTFAAPSVMGGGFVFPLVNRLRLLV